MGLFQYSVSPSHDILNIEKYLVYYVRCQRISVKLSLSNLSTKLL